MCPPSRPCRRAAASACCPDRLQENEAERGRERGRERGHVSEDTANNTPCMLPVMRITGDQEDSIRGWVAVGNLHHAPRVAWAKFARQSVWMRWAHCRVHHTPAESLILRQRRACPPHTWADQRGLSLCALHCIPRVVEIWKAFFGGLDKFWELDIPRFRVSAISL